MKQNQKIAVLVVSILLLVSFWQSAQALTPEKREANKAAFQARVAERKENIAEKREAMEARRVENKERIEEKKEEMQEKRAEIRERRQERFQKISDKITEKINNIINRLGEAGIDVSTIESYLVELEAKNALVEEATATLDEAYETEDKATIQTAHEEVRAAVKDLKTYYQETLRPAIKSAVEEARS